MVQVTDQVVGAVEVEVEEGVAEGATVLQFRPAQWVKVVLSPQGPITMQLLLLVLWARRLQVVRVTPALTVRLVRTVIQVQTQIEIGSAIYHQHRNSTDREMRSALQDRYSM